MDRSLANVLSQKTQEGAVTQSYNTFLTIYSVNLSHRFPDLTDLTSIDYNSVRKIAEFSIACSSIAVEVWDELFTDLQKRQRQSRAA